MLRFSNAAFPNLVLRGSDSPCFHSLPVPCQIVHIFSPFQLPVDLSVSPQGADWETLHLSFKGFDQHCVSDSIFRIGAAGLLLLALSWWLVGDLSVRLQLDLSSFFHPVCPVLRLPRFHLRYRDFLPCSSLAAH